MSLPPRTRITESNAKFDLVTDGKSFTKTLIRNSAARSKHVDVLNFLARVFLPTGYPESVTPDYLRYQILNALQAACNSLAGLISSRSILEGFGVGDASASATDAILVTVLQDFFSRTTTIIGAYYFGSSLSPEAKTYRLLADILNDGAVILDTFSPAFNSVHIPGLRVGALCLSGSLRALCGLVAGGSKSAITLHFATPIEGNGDIGDLNAKDASKETVLALLGMLLGSVVVPYLTTAFSTYSVLFLMVGLHVLINYMAVKGLMLRTLNRQRMALGWDWYRRTKNLKVPSPAQIADLEGLLSSPKHIQNSRTGSTIGYCDIGDASLYSVLRDDHLIPRSLLDTLEEDRYLIWFEKNSRFPRVHTWLKAGYTTTDQRQAWIHAVEVTRLLALPEVVDAESAILTARKEVDKYFGEFMQKMEEEGWNTKDGTMLVAAPSHVLMSVESESVGEEEEDQVGSRKER